MHLSLGGLVKGVETGLTTLVETGNPLIAAGAGAVACVSGNGNSGAPGASNQNLQTFDPLLDSMSAELNPGATPTTYSYAQTRRNRRQRQLNANRSVRRHHQCRSGRLGSNHEYQHSQRSHVRR